MALTMQEQIKVSVLSDGILYDRVSKFVDDMADNKIDAKSQLNALLNYAVDKDTLIQFVKKQASRDWGEDKSYYNQFYRNLDGQLKGLTKLTEEEFSSFLVGLSGTEKGQKVALFVQLLTENFIQHLAAEVHYKGKVQSR